MYKKILTVFIASMFCVLPFIQHIHDEDCGYDAKTDSGCVYKTNTIGNDFFGD